MERESNYDRSKNLVKSENKIYFNENIQFFIDKQYRNKIEVNLEDLDEYILGIFIGFFFNILIIPFELFIFKKQSNEKRMGKYHGIILLIFFLLILLTLKIFSIYSNLSFKLDKIFN